MTFLKSLSYDRCTSQWFRSIIITKIARRIAVNVVSVVGRVWQNSAGRRVWRVLVGWKWKTGDGWRQQSVSEKRKVRLGVFGSCRRFESFLQRTAMSVTVGRGAVGTLRIGSTAVPRGTVNFLRTALDPVVLVRRVAGRLAIDVRLCVPAASSAVVRWRQTVEFVSKASSRVAGQPTVVSRASVAGLEPRPPAHLRAVAERFARVRVQGPKRASARPVGRAGHPDETVVVRQRVPHGVLPPLPVVTIVRKTVREILIDFREFEHFPGRAPYGHPYDRHVRVRRLLRRARRIIRTVVVRFIRRPLDVRKLLWKAMARLLRGWPVERPRRSTVGGEGFFAAVVRRTGRHRNNIISIDPMTVIYRRQVLDMRIDGSEEPAKDNHDGWRCTAVVGMIVSCLYGRVHGLVIDAGGGWKETCRSSPFDAYCSCACGRQRVLADNVPP